MAEKKIVACILGMFIALTLAGSIFAITGAIGNARMILKMDKGEKLEKYILVKNINNVSLGIELSAEGDLKNSINIKDAKFSLGAGEEKKAYFTITASKDGMSESKINIKFTPTDGKNGVGLSSTIIVITNGTSGSGNFSDDNSSQDGNKTAGMEIIKNKLADVSGNKKEIALIATAIIFLVLLVLLVLKKRMKKDDGAEEAKVKKANKEGAGIKPKKKVKESE